MTPELVRTWCETGAREIADSRSSPAVSAPEAILADMDDRLPELAAVARRLYTRWVEGLKG
jgi:hypothetical protein